MYYKILLILCLLFGSIINAQVSVDRNFNLELAEKDSLTSSKIEKSINAFLTEAQKGNYAHKYVDAEHYKKYEFFFNKLSSIGKNSSDFHKPTVLKSYSPDGETYLITVGFYGIKDKNPFIYQITELKLVPHEDYYKFYCRFEDNTKNFKTKVFNDVTYHYTGKIDEEKAQKFANFKDQLSELTKTPKSKLDYYCFNSLDELLKSYGFLYSARQCNFLCYDLGFTDNDGKIYLTGMDNENYRFGYIGEYLYYNLPNVDDIYWPYINGVAIYYSGYATTGENIDELKKQYRDALEQDPAINFLEKFKQGRKASIKRHFCHYVISSFLFEEAIEKHGFDKALKLAYSKNDGALFFKNLKNLLNIDESNFHEKIVEFINN